MRAVFLATLVLVAPVLFAGTPEFRFDRQWPSLQQPWYFIDPGCVAVDDARSVYVADTRNDLVRKFSRDGTLISQWGGLNSGDTSLNKPRCVVLGPDNNLYVSDSFRVRVFDTDGRFIRLLGGGGTCPGRFNLPGEMAFDSLQRLYVLDGLNGRLQRFEDLGQCTASIPGYVAGDFETQNCVIQQPDSCVLVWDGSTTSGQTAFDGLKGLAIDSQDQVVIAEAGSDRVRKFTGDGTFIQLLGGPGSGDGEFDAPVSVSISQNDEVYIADFSNNRIQIFDSLGVFVREIGGDLIDYENNFQRPESITIRPNDEFYVTDNLGFRVMRFDTNGTMTANWSSGSIQQGRLASPAGIAIAADTTAAGNPERIFVADLLNHRINIYETNGQFVRSFGSSTSLGGDFNQPGALAIFGSTLYVTNRFSFVDSFGLDGTVMATWPPNGSDPVNPFLPNCSGKFGGDFGRGLTVGPGGNVYVTDTRNSRILKFDPAGNCLLEIGGPGVLDSPKGVAVDTMGRVLVVDTDCCNAVARVVVFDATGMELPGKQFGAPCPGSICAAGEFVTPFGIDVDINNNIYVTDAAVVTDPATIARHIQVFDSDGIFLTGFSDTGAGPGQSLRPQDVTVSSSGDVYFSDASLSRIEKFAGTPLNLNTRAIVLAGGGPFPGNVLWPATQTNANFAFRTLATQGLGKSSIQYLSADTDLDMDQNGLSDEVDADATNANLELAILGPSGTGSDGFAGDPDIDHLVIYLIDHGGLNAFRMSGSELMASADLAGWVDTWQLAHRTATITLIYDACQSGSFEASLAGPGRTIISSAQENENAYFVSQGTLSFSNFYWSQIFNGSSIGAAFDLAAAATTSTFPGQNPQINTNLVVDAGSNTAVDLAAADAQFIGSGNDLFGEGPMISPLVVSPGSAKLVNLMSGNTATLTADGVMDDDGIGRVWVVIRPPGFEPTSPDNPVADLPTVDLVSTGVANQYQAVYSGFSAPGRYALTLQAVDTLGNSSAALSEQVDVDNPLSRRTVIVTGGDSGDADFAARSLASNLAYRSLDEQGYGPETCPAVPQGACDMVCDSICYLSAGSDVGVDQALTLATLQQAISQWGVDPDGNMIADVQDLTIYLALEPNGSGGYRLNDNSFDDLDASTLAGWLETVQAQLPVLPGTVTVIIDADDSQPFLQQLADLTSKPQILIGSTSAGQSAAFILNGEISFSKFFWIQVLNGARVRQAFNLARNAIRFGNSGPTAQLDDTGNGIANELVDGLLSNRYSIGSGILLAGDDPLIGTAVSNAISATPQYLLFVEDVTSTGTIATVDAVVSDDQGNIQVLNLAMVGGGRYEVLLTGLEVSGLNLDIAVYARDTDSNVSLPAKIKVQSELVFSGGFE